MDSERQNVFSVPITASPEESNVCDIKSWSGSCPADVASLGKGMYMYIYIQVLPTGLFRTCLQVHTGSES